MYGLEGILGNLVTSVATPAIGGLAGEAATDLFKDKLQDELLKEITQTTIGALSGAAVGAGFGALTGGKSGAMSGALTGAVGGGVGGYNAPEISQMFGMNQGVGAPQAGQVVPNSRAALASLPGEPMPSQDALNKAANQASMEYQQQTGFNLPPSSMYSQANLNKPISSVPSPTQPPSAFKGYTDFLKQNYEPLAGGFFLGSSIGASQDTQAQNQQLQQQKALTNLMDQQRARRFSQSTWGYADGGPVEVGLNDPQISVHFPAWAQEQIQREGGLAALQPGMRQGLATGGYINLNPEPPQGYYPMSQIASAHPYPAATPQMQEVVFEEGNFARGGLIDGQGDGMSDDIPARISGREEVRVADGEYLIPRDIAHRYGPEKLKAAMSKIRAAAHAKKGQQVKQDAGKRALISTLGGVKA